MPDSTSLLMDKPILVRKLSPDRVKDWDGFVEDCPSATFFHAAGWQRVIERSFGHRTHFLYAEQGGIIRGVLPLVHIKSRLFGNSLVSNAFCVYGGPATPDEAVLAALDLDAVRLLAETGADCLEYRSLERRHPDWPAKEDLYATFRRPIDPNPEVNLKAIPRKQRAVVRQSLERKLTIEEEDGIDTFFALYGLSVRNLGTPVFAKKFFRNLKQEFGKNCEILVVRHEGVPICSVMSFYFRDEVLPYYAGASPISRSLGGYDFMYWNLILRAAERGARIFDFGRSKQGTGAFAFKKNWGFTPQPIFHEYQLKPGCSIPDINPLNPKYRLFIQGWKKLALPVANFVGPFLARDLG